MAGRNGLPSAGQQTHMQRAVLRFTLLLGWSITEACARQLLEHDLLAKQVESGVCWNGLRAAHAPERSSQPQMTEFVQCVNKGYKPQNMTWERAIARQLPSIKVVGAWWTRRTSPVPLTIITNSDINRLDQVEAQCASWTGPLDTVLYIPLVQDSLDTLTEDNRKTVHKAMVQIASLFQRMESNTSVCALSVTLVYEICKTEDVAILYPVNSLRNLAIAQARIPLVICLDVDMLLSRSLYTALQDDKSKEFIIKAAKSKEAIVLPAFQTAERNQLIFKAQDPGAAMECIQRGIGIADMAVSGDKAALVKAVKDKKILPFAFPYNEGGHGSTNFKRWYKAVEPYSVIPDIIFFEPYVILDRATYPPYDERFRGYGFNKVLHVGYLQRQGYKFVVHPSAFMVHRDHPQSVASQLFRKDASQQRSDKLQYAAATRGLWDGIIHPSLHQGTYKPTVSELTRTLPQCLSWGAKETA